MFPMVLPSLPTYKSNLFNKQRKRSGGGKEHRARHHKYYLNLVLGFVLQNYVSWGSSGCNCKNLTWPKQAYIQASGFYWFHVGVISWVVRTWEAAELQKRILQLGHREPPNLCLLGLPSLPLLGNCSQMVCSFLRNSLACLPIQVAENDSLVDLLENV